jgi:hypothetical protein
MHKKQQERSAGSASYRWYLCLSLTKFRAKIDEIYGASKKKGAGGAGGGSKPTALGGGTSKATLDHNGKLIWD